MKKGKKNPGPASAPGLSLLTTSRLRSKFLPHRSYHLCRQYLETRFLLLSQLL